ncbi:MAG: hypothetical protein ACLGI2_12355 [Acidimicrobiia bacterium]
MRRPLLAAVLAGVLLTACSGGDDGDDSAAPSTTEVPAPTTSPRTGDPFCDFVSDFSDRFGRVDLGLTDPARFRTVMTDAGNAIRDAQGTAPEAIRADVGTLNTYFQRFLNVLQQANFDLTKVPPASIEQLQAPEFTAAGNRLDAYARENCRP